MEVSMAKSWEEIKKERIQKNSTPNNTRKMLSQGFLVSDPNPQQRSWEEIRKEREENLRSSSDSIRRDNQTRQMLSGGFLTANPPPKQRSWEEIRKDRGYVAIEPEPKFQPLTNIKNNYNHGKLAEEENLAWAT